MRSYLHISSVSEHLSDKQGVAGENPACVFKSILKNVPRKLPEELVPDSDDDGFAKNEFFVPCGSGQNECIQGSGKTSEEKSADSETTLTYLKTSLILRECFGPQA